MPFNVKYFKKAVRDLDNFENTEDKQRIIAKAASLSENPFPDGSSKKKIKGIKYPLYRLRIDTKVGSCRLFYTIESTEVWILRIISKKDADKIISVLRKQKPTP